jgi:hypothetical protein
MKGFSLKIVEQVIEFLNKCRTESVARLAENSSAGSNFFPLLFGVVRGVKDVQEQFCIKICGDIELEDNSQPNLDYALSTIKTIFIVMGMNVWNATKDSDIWRIRVEKQIADYLAEVEDCRIYSYTLQERNTTSISFSWNVKL